MDVHTREQLDAATVMLAAAHHLSPEQTAVLVAAQNLMVMASDYNMCLCMMLTCMPGENDKPAYELIHDENNEPVGHRCNSGATMIPLINSHGIFDTSHLAPEDIGVIFIMLGRQLMERMAHNTAIRVNPSSNGFEVQGKPSGKDHHDA